MEGIPADGNTDRSGEMLPDSTVVCLYGLDILIQFPFHDYKARHQMILAFLRYTACAFTPIVYGLHI